MAFSISFNADFSFSPILIFLFPAFYYFLCQMLIIGKFLLFVQACHTKAEYEEYGASICRTNPVFKGMY